MFIDAMTVSVNYASYLEKVLPSWLLGCRKILVVTTPQDEATINLCHQYDLPMHLTEVFYSHGASFAKARAMNEAIIRHNWLEPEGWRLFLDADIELPETWVDTVLDTELRLGDLYGAKRTSEGDKVIDNYDEVCGYFQLFHSTDVNLRISPVLDGSWQHAGGYDTEFQNRWRHGRKAFLPLTVTHLGQAFSNWHGIGNTEKMNEMWEARRERGGIGRGERVNLNRVTGE